MFLQPISLIKYSLSVTIIETYKYQENLCHDSENECAFFFFYQHRNILNDNVSASPSENKAEQNCADVTLKVTKVTFAEVFQLGSFYCFPGGWHNRLFHNSQRCINVTNMALFLYSIL